LKCLELLMFREGREERMLGGIARVAESAGGEVACGKGREGRRIGV